MLFYFIEKALFILEIFTFLYFLLPLFFSLAVKIRYFEKGLSKSLKKVNFIFSFEPSPFEWTKLSKKGLELVTSCSSGYKTISEQFLD